MAGDARTSPRATAQGGSKEVKVQLQLFTKIIKTKSAAKFKEEVLYIFVNVNERVQ